MNFDELREIYRLEMNSTEPTSVDGWFYADIVELEIDLEKEYERQYAIDPGSIMTEAAEQRRNTVRRLGREIACVRLKKITDLAVRTAFSQEDLGGIAVGLNDEERTLGYALRAIIKDFYVNRVGEEAQASNPAPEKEQSPAPEKTVHTYRDPSEYRRIRSEILSVLSSDSWTPSNRIVKKVDAPRVYIFDTLDRMVREQKVQRSPPRAKGRRYDRDIIKWRLVE